MKRFTVGVLCLVVGLAVAGQTHHAGDLAVTISLQCAVPANLPQALLPRQNWILMEQELRVSAQIFRVNRPQLMWVPSAFHALRLQVACGSEI